MLTAVVLTWRVLSRGYFIVFERSSRTIRALTFLTFLE